MFQDSWPVCPRNGRGWEDRVWDPTAQVPVQCGPQHCAIAALLWLKLWRERWACSRSWNHEGDSLGTEEGGGVPWALFPPTLLYASTSSCHWPKLPRKPEEKENEADPRRGRWGKGSEQRGYPPIHHHLFLTAELHWLSYHHYTKEEMQGQGRKSQQAEERASAPKSVGLWSVHHAVSLTVLGSTWKLLLQFSSLRGVAPLVCQWPTSCHSGPWSNCVLHLPIPRHFSNKKPDI